MQHTSLYLLLRRSHLLIPNKFSSSCLLIHVALETVMDFSSDLTNLTTVN